MNEKLSVEEFIPENFVEYDEGDRDTIPCPPPTSVDFGEDDFPY